MAWDFTTEPEYQQKLDWADAFVREEVEPLDLLWPGLEFTPPDERLRKVLDPLKAQVREQRLWATHLSPDLGGEGDGQVKLCLLNEILGRSSWAPIVFGCQAPDTGNAEIIAHYGTAEQKERYLRPLLDGEIFSCYSMTEPHAGADPTMFRTRAVRDGDEWVLDGWKFFSSNARTAAFLIVMAVTDPDVSPYEGMSMFLVPSDTPGVVIERNVGLAGEPLGEGSHALIHYDGVRLPADAVLGGEGQAFAIAQTRLGGGRIHHAMRTIGLAQQAIDMMCERALSRETQGSRLADKQFVQGYIADSYAQLAQFRLFVLHTAWAIDTPQRLPEGPQGHRRGEGADAGRAARHRPPGPPGARRAGRQQRDAVPQDGARRQRPRPGRRPDRGPQGHRGQAGPARPLPRRGAVAVAAPPDPAGRSPGEVRRAPGASKWGTCDRRRSAGAAGSTSRACPAGASRWRSGSSPAAPRTRSTRSVAATSTARCASRRPPRPSRATAASCASGGSSRPSRAPTSPTPPPSPPAPTPTCSAGPST